MYTGPSTLDPPIPNPPTNLRHHQRIPVPCKCASHCRDQIKKRHDPQCLAPADLLSQHARGHRPENGSRKPNRNRQPQRPRRQVEHAGQLLRRPGNDSRIKSKQQPAQRSNYRSLRKIPIQNHLPDRASTSITVATACLTSHSSSCRDCLGDSPCSCLSPKLEAKCPSCLRGRPLLRNRLDSPLRSIRDYNNIRPHQLRIVKPLHGPYRSLSPHALLSRLLVSSRTLVQPECGLKRSSRNTKPG